MKKIELVVDYDTEEEAYNFIKNLVANEKCISFEIKKEKQIDKETDEALYNLEKILREKLGANGFLDMLFMRLDRRAEASAIVSLAEKYGVKVDRNIYKFILQ